MRSNATVSKGFSLIELLIAIAILGVVMSVGIPAYQGYLETAKMTKFSAAYDFSVRLAQQTDSKDSARIAMGLVSACLIPLQHGLSCLMKMTKVWRQAVGRFLSVVDQEIDVLFLRRARLTCGLIEGSRDSKFIDLTTGDSRAIERSLQEMKPFSKSGHLDLIVSLWPK